MSMRFRHENDDKYIVNFMRSTQEIIENRTVKEFINYLKLNATLEDRIVEYINGKAIKCWIYDLKESNSRLHKNFIVTADNRLFYWRTVSDKIELI